MLHLLSVVCAFSHKKVQTEWHRYNTWACWDTEKEHFILKKSPLKNKCIFERNQLAVPFRNPKEDYFFKRSICFIILYNNCSFSISCREICPLCGLVPAKINQEHLMIITIFKCVWHWSGNVPLKGLCEVMGRVFSDGWIEKWREQLLSRQEYSPPSGSSGERREEGETNVRVKLQERQRQQTEPYHSFNLEFVAKVHGR